MKLLFTTTKKQATMYNQIFQHHFLINGMHQGHRKTFVASSQRLPDFGGNVFAYIRETDDFVNVEHSEIVAVIKTKVQP